MTNNYQEPLSALLDDELTDRELGQILSDVDQDAEGSKQFSRYALIGDVLRKEQELVIDDSFAASISDAVANIDISGQTETLDVKVDSSNDSNPSTSLESENVSSIASHPSWGKRLSGSVAALVSSQAGKGAAQFAIAASVALVAVFGVSNMQVSETERMSSPVLNTVPIVQDFKPVSLDGNQKKPTANQVTQSRINALMADHNQQIRAAEELKDSEKEAQNEKGN